MTIAEQPKREPPTHVVGVGVSSGRIDLLEAFLAALPATTSLAYVVIGATAGFDEPLRKHLAQRSKLRLQMAEQGTAIQRGDVYLLPAEHQIRVEAGRLLLSPSSADAVEIQPINTLFRSLASGFGPNAVGVLLSSGGDGVAGACAIHQAGGLVLAQSDVAKAFTEKSAETQAAHVHLVQSPTELAALITHHVSQSTHLQEVTPRRLSSRAESRAGSSQAQHRSSNHAPPQAQSPTHPDSDAPPTPTPHAVTIPAAEPSPQSQPPANHRQPDWEQTLESELRSTQASLQALVNRFESVHQELQATNAELLKLRTALPHAALLGEASPVVRRPRLQLEAPEPVRKEPTAAEDTSEYRWLYENAAVGIAHLDTEGRWVRVNPHLCEILGYNPDELRGMTFHQLADPEDLQGDIQHFQALIRGERDNDCHESRYHHRDGHVVWVSLTLARQVQTDGQTIGCIAVIQDVTQRKKTEIALEKARRMADSANRAKSSFVTNISHELRSPMTAVLGFADMLANEIQVPEQLQKIETLRRNGQFLLRLLDDILDLSKIESRRFQSDSEPCDLMALIDEVEVLMQGRASQIGSQLWFHFPTPLPTTIYTSSMRVRQILVNLIANAFKFPLRGDVNVTIRYRAVQGEDEQVEPYVEFEVADTGVEINQPPQASSFAAFTPADPEIARRFAGRGSGLSITKRLVSTLGGVLEFSTGKKGGSTFLARLPVGDVVDMELINRQSRVPAAPVITEPSQLKSIAGKILVADDRRDIWQVTKYFLERSGAEVAVAEDGRQAVDAVQAAARDGKPFDLLLLDMQMPVMNGLEAVRELREAGFSLPIIALTADAMKGERQRCLAAGCDDYLTKPIDGALLTETVAKHLGEKT